jgi:phenylacetate-coenzyme A ligase PaaK-like adenylate-forming protein
MTLVGALRARQLRPSIEQRRRVYDRDLHTEARHDLMLERLNAVWAVASTNVPRYRHLVATGQSPRTFDSLDQFTQTVPPLTKAESQTAGSDLVDPRRPGERRYTTGGSTGSPTSFEGWNSELEPDNANRWIGRGEFGITPAAPYFLVWGHHHLLGSGPKARARAALQTTKDRLQGRIRFNAYNLSEQRAREAGDLILQTRPKYLIGYSSALDLLARANASRSGEFAKVGLKAAIACAESYPRDDSPELIAKTFGCPSAMEYGAVETQITAYTLPDGTYRVFWLDNLFELGEPGPGGGRVLRITSLYERKTPLIRYEICDEVLPVESEPLIGPARIRKILGRISSVITLPDGKAVHTAAISRAISDRRDVQQFQIVEMPSGLAIRAVPTSDASRESITNHVRANLVKISPSLRDAPIDFVERIEQSVAGKTPLVVRAQDGADR